MTTLGSLVLLGSKHSALTWTYTRKNAPAQIQFRAGHLGCEWSYTLPLCAEWGGGQVARAKWPWLCAGTKLCAEASRQAGPLSPMRGADRFGANAHEHKASLCATNGTGARQRKYLLCAV